MLDAECADGEYSQRLYLACGRKTNGRASKEEQSRGCHLHTVSDGAAPQAAEILHRELVAMKDLSYDESQSDGFVVIEEGYIGSHVLGKLGDRQGGYAIEPSFRLTAGEGRSSAKVWRRTPTSPIERRSQYSELLHSLISGQRYPVVPVIKASLRFSDVRIQQTWRRH